jgi:Ner family transcriptional regulator
MNKTTRPKKSAQTDWHRADIVAVLRKAGWSLRKLSASHGYASPSTLTHALDRPWPKGERLIAAAIGVAPETIWPTRYKGSTRKANESPATDLRKAA